jgi:hypothetical protein
LAYVVNWQRAVEAPEQPGIVRRGARKSSREFSETPKSPSSF